MANSNLSREGFLWYTLISGYSSLREANVGSEAEAMEERCTVLFLWLAQLAFLPTSGPPAQGYYPTVVWSLPHPSVIKKMYRRLVYRPVGWKHFLIGISSQMTVVCVKATKTNEHMAQWRVGSFVAVLFDLFMLSKKQYTDF